MNGQLLFCGFVFFFLFFIGCENREESKEISDDTGKEECSINAVDVTDSTSERFANSPETLKDIVYLLGNADTIVLESKNACFGNGKIFLSVEQQKKLSEYFSQLRMVTEDRKGIAKLSTFSFNFVFVKDGKTITKLSYSRYGKIKSQSGAKWASPEPEMFDVFLQKTGVWMCMMKFR